MVSVYRLHSAAALPRRVRERHRSERVPLSGRGRPQSGRVFAPSMGGHTGRSPDLTGHSVTSDGGFSANVVSLASVTPRAVVTPFAGVRKRPRDRLRQHPAAPGPAVTRAHRPPGAQGPATAVDPATRRPGCLVTADRRPSARHPGSGARRPRTRNRTRSRGRSRSQNRIRQRHRIRVAHSRTFLIRSVSCPALASALGGPPQTRRSSLWITPCGLPLWWL
jgi:hypothetical protein